VAREYHSIKVTAETFALLREAKSALTYAGTDALPKALRGDLGDEVTVSTIVGLGAKQILSALERRR
jgi:hypothetical protein